MLNVKGLNEVLTNHFSTPVTIESYNEKHAKLSNGLILSLPNLYLYDENWDNIGKL